MARPCSWPTAWGTAQYCASWHVHGSGATVPELERAIEGCDGAENDLRGAGDDWRAVAHLQRAMIRMPASASAKRRGVKWFQHLNCVAQREVGQSPAALRISRKGNFPGASGSLRKERKANMETAMESLAAFKQDKTVKSGSYLGNSLLLKRLRNLRLPENPLALLSAVPADAFFRFFPPAQDNFQYACWVRSRSDKTARCVSLSSSWYSSQRQSFSVMA